MAVIKRPVSPLIPEGENISRDFKKTQKEIYRKAAAWGLRVTPLDIEGVIKKFGIKVYREEMEADLSGYIEARPTGCCIGINKFQTPRRQRFTLAHEFAHFLFDGNSLGAGRHSDAIMLRSQEFDHREQRANEFAAELLMPAEVFIGQVEAGVRDVAALGEQFDVSMAAVRYRAFKLGYIKRY